MNCANYDLFFFYQRNSPSKSNYLSLVLYILFYFKSNAIAKRTRSANDLHFIFCTKFLRWVIKFPIFKSFGYAVQLNIKCTHNKLTSTLRGPILVLNENKANKLNHQYKKICLLLYILIACVMLVYKVVISCSHVTLKVAKDFPQCKRCGKDVGPKH